MAGRKNKCYWEVIDEKSGEFFASVFYSSLIKHVKDVALALLSHMLANAPPQLSLSPASLRNRVCMAELIATDSGQATGAELSMPSLLQALQSWNGTSSHFEVGLLGTGERLGVSPLVDSPTKGNIMEEE